MKMAQSALIFLWLVCSTSIFAQIDSSRANFSLFVDHKAVTVGDLVTVYIMEFSSGSNEAATTTKKSDGFGFEGSGAGALANAFPNVGAKVGKQSEFDGQGSTSQQANLRAKMTARITERLSHNSLRIEGRRDVDVNGDKQTIILTGIVRPQDISSGNIVYSYNIADAKISYKGKGAIHQGQKPSFLFRLINWIF